jgi:hypothetical protein
MSGLSEEFGGQKDPSKFDLPRRFPDNTNQATSGISDSSVIQQQFESMTFPKNYDSLPYTHRVEVKDSFPIQFLYNQETMQIILHYLIGRYRIFLSMQEFQESTRGYLQMSRTTQERTALRRRRYVK